MNGTMAADGKKSGSLPKSDWVPFDFLLGEQYSGYYQAINASRDLKPMPSKLPKLFWGLSHEQRRRLATHMLEEGHVGAHLERAIRVALGGGRSGKRRRRVQSSAQLWTATQPGDLDGRGPDGMPIFSERFHPRTPFLIVDSEEACINASEHRVEKPRERAECEPARRRREFQELMRKRVQVQAEYLTGLEMDRRDWRRSRTGIVTRRATSSKHQLLKRRLRYGEERSTDGTSGSETASLGGGAHRRDKENIAGVIAAERTSNQRSRAEKARMIRCERDVLRIVRSVPCNIARPRTALGVSQAQRMNEKRSATQALERALQSLGVVEIAPLTCSLSQHDPQTEKAECVECTGNRAERHTDDENVAQSSVNRAPSGERRDHEDPANVENIDSDTAPSKTRTLDVVGPVADEVATAGDGVGMGAQMKTRAVELTEEPTKESSMHTVKKLLRASSTVAIVTGRPLSITPPAILMVDGHQATESPSSRVNTGSWPSQSRRTSSSSSTGKASRGGGYRTSSQAPSLHGSRRSSGTAPGRADVQQSRFPFDGSTTAGAVLDLDALSAAGSVLIPPAASSNPRGRFAPMSDEELASFLKSFPGGDTTQQ